MKKLILYTFGLLILNNICFAQSNKYKLVWNDEFTTTGYPDTNKWKYEEGLIRNQELQYYTKARKENIDIENGNLVITALKENYEGAKYTSASIRTKNKFNFRYGKVEIRAKFPSAIGTWPALWLLGMNENNKVNWPLSGEIDMLENVGWEPDTIHFNVHTKAYHHLLKTNKGKKLFVKNGHLDFHVYGLEWTKEKVDFYFDHKKVFTFKNEHTGMETWPFDNYMFIIMNLSIGGFWGGIKGVDDSKFPHQFMIDYVRVWQK